MLLEQMTREETEMSITRGDILIIPIGSIEQHGPHLPLATDLFSVLGIAKIVDEHINSVIAPPIYYTYAKSMQMFPGTVSIEATTLISLVRDIVGEFLRQGFKKILFFNGHHQNLFFIQEGIRIALGKYLQNNAKIILTSWWDLIPEEQVKEIYPSKWEGWRGGHASLMETSLALSLNPKLVRANLIIDDEPDERLPYDIFPTPSSLLPKSGVFSLTSLSSSEIGDKLRDAVVEQVQKLIDKEFSGIK